MKDLKDYPEPQWSELERKSARRAFPQELAKLADKIATGNTPASKVEEALWQMQKKITAAKQIGVTKVDKTLPRIYGDRTYLARYIGPLMELAQSDIMIRNGIYERLHKAFGDLGLEPEFLAYVAHPARRPDNNDSLQKEVLEFLHNKGATSFSKVEASLQVASPSTLARVVRDLELLGLLSRTKVGNSGGDDILGEIVVLAEPKKETSGKQRFPRRKTRGF